MNSNRKYSIIVPVYNAEATLARCVESILTQDYGNFELILVDDGSKDNSGRIIEEYAKKDSRIVPLHKPNGGVSSARNFGLEKAIGDYIVFIDSDDYVVPNHLSDFNSYDGDVIIGGLQLRVDERHESLIPPTIRCEHESFGCILRDVGGMTYFRSPWCKAYRRSIISDNHLLFDHRIHYGEDYLFTLEFLCYAQEIDLIPNCTYIYLMPNDEKVYRMAVDEYIVNVKSIEKTLRKLENTKGELNDLIHKNKTLLYREFYVYICSLTRWKRFKNVFNFLIRHCWLITSQDTYVNRFKKNIEIIKTLLV